MSVSADATTSHWEDPGGDLPPADAARLLDVPEDVLTSWVERMGFPQAVGAPGAPRYRRAELEALRATLPASHSVEGAVRAAQERLGR